ncbi:hypothetical protein LUZ63_015897 [Rhynchospora breviuscula]|uniref:F-box domain-containing protein n=1 Tax=Rhynchospora breviuscula TaxID=2022672 RepID=A0A9Q0CD54_9POAL|nr:hypothetical protein LUZ63_015897 [Rhynchospora breviuscula]
MDMISSLPDCLLHLIMSFLTAQDAVRTCILAKRWMNLWTTLPFLDFDLSKFEYDGKEDGFEPRSKKFDKFRDFVCMTLEHREASYLQKFHLSCTEISKFNDNYDMFIQSCIGYALKHNLQWLKIDYELLGPPPLGVFTCASLVDVSLFSFFSYSIRAQGNSIDVINLPCLRRLYLRGFILYQDFVNKLFSGCPVLGFLHLENCEMNFSTMNTQSLKYLKVVCSPKCHKALEKRTGQLINAPNLLSFYLRICPRIIGDKMLLKMPSLTSAISDVHMPKYSSYEGKSNMIFGLSNVQSLILCGTGIIMDLLENGLLNCPEFSNLKDLSVKGLCLYHHFSSLVSFLNLCPNLEKLSLSHHDNCCWVHACGNQEPLQMASFKCKLLKTVDVKFFKYDSKSLQIVKYLQDITFNSMAEINMSSHSDSCLTSLQW